MPKRTICITKPTKIASKMGSLIIGFEEPLIKVPFEDIWVVILESPEISLSSRVLADLSSTGIGVMTCNSKHLPNGLLLPLAAHSRHAKIVEDQLLIPKPLKKRLWQAIVIQKIENQAFVLEQQNPEKAADLRKIAKGVLSGDSNGREAVAASLYFKALLPNGGRRNSDLTPILDYGYAIVRAGIARYAVSGGWLVSRGIHHCSDLNAFNLVDDFIEPFRPAVDLLALRAIQEKCLNPSTKRTLVEIFEYCVEVDGAKHSIQSAITAMIDSFKRAVLENDASELKLPKVIPLEKWTGEEK